MHIIHLVFNFSTDCTCNCCKKLDVKLNIAFYKWISRGNYFKFKFLLRKTILNHLSKSARNNQVPNYIIFSIFKYEIHSLFFNYSEFIKLLKFHYFKCYLFSLNNIFPSFSVKFNVK